MRVAGPKTGVSYEPLVCRFRHYDLSYYDYGMIHYFFVAVVGAVSSYSSALGSLEVLPLMLGL